MPPVSRIDAAPVDLRRELEELAVRHGFGDIDALHQWWTEHAPEDHQASRSGVGRYVQKLKARMQAFRDSADLMRQIKISFGAENWVDLQSDFLQTTAAMLQQEISELIINGGLKTEDIPLDRLMGAYGRFASAVSAETDKEYKRLREERDREQARLKEIETQAEQGNKKLDAETLAYIKEVVYGIV